MGCGGSKKEEEQPPPPVEEAPPTEAEPEAEEPQEGDPGDFRERIAQAGPDQLLIIRFFKTDCDRCAAIGQFYEGLVGKYEQVIFLDANLGRNLHAIGQMNVMAVPTFIAFKNHREVQRYIGTDPMALEQMIAANM